MFDKPIIHKKATKLRRFSFAGGVWSVIILNGISHKSFPELRRHFFRNKGRKISLYGAIFILVSKPAHLVTFCETMGWILLLRGF